MTTIPDDAREIYPMPMFATIVTASPRELADWYAKLGFWELFAMPGSDSDPRMIHLRRLKYQDHPDRRRRAAGEWPSSVDPVVLRHRR